MLIKLSRKRVIILNGVVWLGIGTLLLRKGLKFLLNTVDNIDNAPLVNALSSFSGSIRQSIFTIICLGLIIGYAKKAVLKKSIDRNVKRIHTLNAPIPITQVYSKSYLIIILAMMSLGLLMRFSRLPLDIRGVIDVAVGSALIHGAMIYFRRSTQEELQPESK